jgi:hypothetical protein
LNDKGFGTASGKMQMLLMRRNYDHEDASSGTVATTLRYRSPERYPFRGGLAYIYSAELFEGGSLNPRRGAAWVLPNGRFSTLVEAYGEIDLAKLGLQGSDLKLGRVVSDYDFAPTLPIRQKPQALQGVFLTFDEWEDVSLDLGYIDRFSSWSSRTEGPDYPRAEFKPVEDVVSAHDGIAPPSGASGMQFINLNARLGSHTNLTIYDLYGRHLYNTFGVKSDTLLSSGEESSLKWKNHYITQKDVGTYENQLGQELSVHAWESSLPYRRGRFLLEPGIFSVMSDDDLRHPMESSLTWEYTLSWFTRAYRGNSDSVFLKSTYDFGDTLLYAMWFATDHQGNVGNGAFDQEIDIVVKHGFTDNLQATLKLGYGHQNNRNADNRDRTDMRLFVTYTF